MTAPVAVVTPDDRGRFTLRRYLPSPAPARWILSLEDDGKRMILEAVDDE